MAVPVTVTVTEAQIDLSWSALASPADGNSAVLAYNLYWDNGSGTTAIALLDALSTTLSVPGLTGGTYYRFKVRARNIYGPGAFSTELVVLASDLPAQVDIPTVTIATSATDVVVAWTAPEAHAAVIDQYQVLLLKSDGTYSTHAETGCDGTDVTAPLTCDIPMTTIVTVTGMAVDTLIRVKIAAHNTNGWGAFSELNTAGATIETYPTQMAAPVFVLASSSVTEIALSWTASTGTAAGGASVSVSGYVLSSAEGAGAYSTHSTPTATAVTTTGLTGGVQYHYRVAAQNKYGIGTFSTSVSVVAA
jgi:hypothetical protein